MPKKALKSELTAPQLIKSRYSSNESLAENALRRFLDIFESLRRQESEISSALLKRSRAENVSRQYYDIRETLGILPFFLQQKPLWGVNAEQLFVTSDLLKKAEKKLFGE